MAVSIGSLKEFNLAKDELAQYAERMGHYFDTNGVNTAEKKRLIFPGGIRSKYVQASPKCYRIPGAH